MRACGFQERGQNRKTSLPQHVQCGERRCATRMGACHDHGRRTALAVRRRFGIRGLRLSDMTHRSARAVLRTPRHSRAGQLRRSRNESGRCLRRGARGVGYGGAPGAVWPVLRNAPRFSRRTNRRCFLAGVARNAVAIDDRWGCVGNNESTLAEAAASTPGPTQTS